MKILLINPPNPRRDKGAILPPLCFVYLAAYLKKHGYSSKILDLDALGANTEELSNLIKGESPDIIGVTGYTHTRFQAYEVVRKAKKLFPDSLMVVGGYHFTWLAEESLANILEIDCVVRGEGEITFLELVRAWQEGKKKPRFHLETGFPSADILGITYRKNGEIISNPARPPHEKVEDFIVSVEDLPQGNYEFLVPFRRGEGGKAVLILTGRGCPNRCIFCVQGGKKRRFISIDKVIEDIKAKTAYFKTSYVVFYDPSLTLDTLYTEELCRAIIKNNLNIKWYCESRVNINLEILQLMRKAGCISIDFGLESGSPKVLKNIKKGIIIDQVLPFAKKCYELGIHAHAFIMVSLPGETKEDARLTLNMLEKLAPYIGSYSFGVLSLFPGTEIYEICKLNNKLPVGFSWFKPWEDPINKYLGMDFSIPLYFEHLSPKYVKGVFLKELDRIWLTKKRTVFQVARKHFIPTFFDWKSESLLWKIKKFARLFNMIKYRLMPRHYENQ